MTPINFAVLYVIMCLKGEFTSSFLVFNLWKEKLDKLFIKQAYEKHMCTA